MYANNKILNEVAPLHEMTKEKNWRKKLDRQFLNLLKFNPEFIPRKRRKFLLHDLTKREKKNKYRGHIKICQIIPQFSANG